MNKQFTTSEVRDTAQKGRGRASFLRDKGGIKSPEIMERLISVADAFADLLEVQEKAVPVAWRTFDGEGNYDYRDYENNEHYRDWYVSRNGAKYANWVEPLYSHPAPAARVTDAMVNAAMRADFCGHNVADALMCGTDWNTEVMRAALEAAIATQENPNG